MFRSAILGLCCLTALACVQSPPAQKTESNTRTIEYIVDGVTLEGVLVWNPAIAGPRPGILLAHDAGTAKQARDRATQFAKLGYVAFVADLFGKGSSPKDRADAAKKLNDRNVSAKRLEGALNLLAKQPQSTPHKIAGVGYGLGATSLLDVARTDADLVGIACLHGDWSSTESPHTKMTTRVLAMMGSEDPQASIDKLVALERELRATNADWDVIRYGGVAGDFTNPNAGSNVKSGFAYDIDADVRAHAAVNQFLSQLFPPTRLAAAVSPKPETKPAAPVTPKGVPEKALKVLQYVDEHDRAMDGYEGGRHFGNFEGRLPNSDRNGRRIRYREWDVNPLRPSVNRGPERLVTGSDGSAHYTDDHYSTFKKIR